MVTGIDRAVFERIRLALVSGGLTPDYRATQGADKAAAYATALSALPVGVAVYGHGTAAAKGGLIIPRITVTRAGVGRGAYDIHAVNYVRRDVADLNSLYDKVETGDPLSLTYEVRVITAATGGLTAADIERQLVTVVFSALGAGRRVLRAVDSNTWAFTGAYFTLDFISFTDVTVAAETRETVIIYRTVPAVVTPPLTVGTAKPLIDIGQTVVIMD